MNFVFILSGCNTKKGAFGYHMHCAGLGTVLRTFVSILKH